MTDLLVNRQFQHYWMNLVVELLRHNFSLSQIHSANRHSIISALSGVLSTQNGNNCCEQSRCATIQVSIVEPVEELTNAIHLAIETFLNSFYMSRSDYFASKPTVMNRELSTLYSTRVRLDRFCLSKKMELPQFGFIARRLTRLLRVFTISLSSPFTMNSCAFFASSICDMLYRIEEYLSCHVELSSLACSMCITPKLKLYRKAVNNFYINVVKEIYIRNQEACEKNQSLHACSQHTLDEINNGFSRQGNQNRIKRSSSSSKLLTNTTIQRRVILINCKTSGNNRHLKENKCKEALDHRKYVRRSLPSWKSINTSPTVPNFSNLSKRMLDTNVEKPLSDQREGINRDLESAKRIFETIKNDAERQLIKSACNITREVVDELSQRLNKL